MGSSGKRSGRTAAIRTFLIADIRGYTRFTAERGDDAASRLAERFAEVATGGVEAWQGELVELRGDEALAVFESARLALRAAVELQSAFADETASDPDLPMGVGIGLDAGEAVPVGDGYRGAALNLAARLCSSAEAGEIVVTENLAHLAGQMDGLVFDAASPTIFKGYEAPVPVVRVRSATPLDVDRRPQHVGRLAAHPLPPELDAIVPIVGRERELRWLQWHWLRARHGHGRAVVLSGPPGIGKTRSAAELASTARDLGAAVVYWPAGRPNDGSEPWVDDELKEPLLVVVDDLDSAGEKALDIIVRRAGELSGRSTLLLVTHRLEASRTLRAAVTRIGPPERQLSLGPVDHGAVRAIAALYAGRMAEDAPILELASESGGVPAAVHRVASLWARTAATLRLGESADRTSSERRGLRAAEAALMSDVSDLEHARERDRLFVERPADDGESTPVRTICPYKGLAEFEAADADYYFGRERLIAELIARFVGGTFMALVGDSGSGKSSVLRAGLLPALAGGVLPGSDSWPQVLMRPGDHPMAELRRVLTRAYALDFAGDEPGAALDRALAGLGQGQRLVLVIDQFEEVFNATRDDAERTAFIDLVTRDHPGLKVVISLRADHYARCAAYPALARLMGSDQILVGPLTASEVAAVIEHPAQRVGLRVEPALTNALVEEAGTEPGVLPLLSTALLELWQVRDSGRLTMAAYVATGGLRGAIARLAEATFAGFDPHRQTVARSLLLRLAGPGEGSELVRRRVPLDELDSDRDAMIGEVLATLTEARLLTTGDGHVEVAHEALLREWPRLQVWLAEDAAGRQVRLHLVGAVREWHDRGRETSDLYRGARLATALEWAADHGTDLNASERAFLDESRHASERDVERQRRLNRRLRGLLAGAAALLVVAVGAAGFAALQAQRAQDEGQRAEAQAAAAEVQRVKAETQAVRARSRELIASAVAAVASDPGLGKLLAIEAVSLTDEPSLQSTNVLHQVLAADPILARYRWPEDQETGELWTQLDPSGTLLVASGTFDGPSEYLEVAKPGTGAVLWSYRSPQQGILIGPAYFSRDGASVMAGLIWVPPEEQPDLKPPSGVLGVMVWDASDGRLLRRIDVGPCGGFVSDLSETRLLVRTATLDPGDGTVCTSPDYPEGPAIAMVDLDSGAVKVLAGHASLVYGGGSLSGDGRFAAFDTLIDGVITSLVLDVDTGKPVFELDTDEIGFRMNLGWAGARQLNSDGSLLLFGDRPILVYDVGTGPGAPIAQLAGLGGDGFAAAFDPLDDTVYATARDGALRRWDATTGEAISTTPSVGTGWLSFDADGRRALVADLASRTAVLLSPGIKGELGEVSTCHGFIPASSLQASAGLAAFYELCDGVAMVQVVDPSKPALLRMISGYGTQTFAMDPAGGRFVGQRFDGISSYGPLEIVDLRSAAVIVELEGLCAWEQSSTSAREDSPGCRTYPDVPFPIWSRVVRWSPDGTMIAVVDLYENDLVVWDARDGHLLYARPHDPDRLVAEVIFSPDSRQLVLTHWDTGPEARGLLEVLSTSTWQAVAAPRLDANLPGLGSLRPVSYTPDGSTLIVVGADDDRAPSIKWLDALTFDVTRSVDDAHANALKSAAMSPDGTKLATGASDGQLRVWDLGTGELLQQMSFGTQVQGVRFLDDSRLMVTPQGRGLLIMSVDPAELERLARRSLTRGFTSTECTTYGISPCPTLEQMRGG